LAHNNNNTQDKVCGAVIAGVHLVHLMKQNGAKHLPMLDQANRIVL